MNGSTSSSARVRRSARLQRTSDAAQRPTEPTRSLVAVPPSQSSDLPHDSGHPDALSFAQNSTSVNLTIPRDALISVRQPLSNLEALFLHISPPIQDQSSTSNQISTERSFHSRQSLNPQQPSGTSEASTDKRHNLIEIIKADPDLRRRGIYIRADPALVRNLNQRLLARLNHHQDPDFLARWHIGLMSETEALEENTLTDEAITTGIFRTTIYGHCNRYVRHRANFQESCWDEAKNRSWGDAPTTTVSRLDCAGRHNKKCCCGAEHKRRRVCTFSHLNKIFNQAGLYRQEGGDEAFGIHIRLSNDDQRLLFESESQLDSSEEKLIAQVSLAQDAALTSLGNHAGFRQQDHSQYSVQLCRPRRL